MAKIGVRNLVIAECTGDAVAAITFAVPVAVPKLAQIDVKTASDTATDYYDDGPGDIASALGDIDVELDVADLTLEMHAFLLGHTITGGVMVSNSADTAPYVALGFKSLKANGKYRYAWLLKGKFSEPDDSNKTLGEKVEYQHQKLAAKFVKTENNGDWKRTADEDAAGYSSTTGTNWFTSPLGSGDTTAPTVACVPVDTGTAAVDANIVLTFSEEMDTSSIVYGESVIVQKADGTQIAGAGAWSVGNTIYTFNPTSNMDGSTAHLAIVTKACKDLAGNKLAAVNVFNFTTA